MTTPVNDNKDKPKPGAKSSDDGGGLVKVRLIARAWQRPVPDTDPVRYERLKKGAEIEVTEKEFEALTDGFKPAFEKIED